MLVRNTVFARTHQAQIHEPRPQGRVVLVGIRYTCSAVAAKYTDSRGLYITVVSGTWFQVAGPRRPLITERASGFSTEERFPSRGHGSALHYVSTVESIHSYGRCDNPIQNRIPTRILWTIQRNPRESNVRIRLPASLQLAALANELFNPV